MQILLGNLTTIQIEERLGITLKEDERSLLNTMRQEKAENIKPGAWHCFDIPFVIVCGDTETATKVCEILGPYSKSMKEPIRIAKEN